jgi:hypothetical protein
MAKPITEKEREIIHNYIYDFSKACPEEEFSVEQFPNFGELDWYVNKYTELMDRCMEGDDEVDKVIVEEIQKVLDVNAFFKSIGK